MLRLHPYEVIDYIATGSGCQGLDGDGSICRCSTIEPSTIEIESVSLADLAVRLFPQDLLRTRRGQGTREFIDPLVGYAAERLVRGYEAYDRDYWDFEIIGGYYGEEVGAVLFSHPELEAAIHTFSALAEAEDTDACVRLALQAEYGELLPGLSTAHFTIRDLYRTDIIVGRPDYLARLVDDLDTGPPRVGRDRDRRIQGLVQATDVGVRLIDGYHRLALYDTRPPDLTPTGRLRRPRPLAYVVASTE